MERYQRGLKTGAYLLAVLWAIALLILCCPIYPPYGMVFSVTASLRATLLSRLPIPSLLISAAFLLTREAKDRETVKSEVLFLSLSVLVALISFFTKELPDLSYRSDLTSAAVFLLSPLFLVSLTKKRFRSGPLNFLIAAVWVILLCLAVVFSFLPHVLFQTLFDLYLILPFSLSSALFLLSSFPDDDQRAVILISSLALPGFVVLRRFFAIDAIAFPSILFPASALLFAVMTVLRTIRAKMNPENNQKNKK